MGKPCQRIIRKIGVFWDRRPDWTAGDGSIRRVLDGNDYNSDGELTSLSEAFPLGLIFQLFFFLAVFNTAVVNRVTRPLSESDFSPIGFACPKSRTAIYAIPDATAVDTHGCQAAQISIT